MLFSPVKLIKSIITFCLTISTIWLSLEQHIPRFNHDSLQNYSYIIPINDPNQMPFLSLLSMDIDDDFDLDVDVDDENDSIEDRINFSRQCRNEYSNNPYYLASINQFESEYRPKKCIFWYTLDTFYHRIINKILRSGNFQLMNKYKNFIQDLHRQIFFRHRRYFQRNIVQHSKISYRGATLTDDDLKHLTIGNLITFRSFLSTSLSEQVALKYAGNVLFQIEINNRTSLFAIYDQISDISPFKDEEEILFSIGNVFRVKQIQWCTKRSLWDIQLSLQQSLQCRLSSTKMTRQRLSWKWILEIF